MSQTNTILIEWTIDRVKQNETTVVPLKLTPKDAGSAADLSAAVVAADDNVIIEWRTKFKQPVISTFRTTDGTITLDPVNKVINLHFLAATTRAWDIPEAGVLVLFGTLRVTQADGTPRQYSGQDGRVTIEGSYTQV